MPNTNDFLPFAVGPSARVTTQSDYAALTAVTNGFGTGAGASVANSADVNKVLRQASEMAATIAGYVVAQSSVDVIDDGDVAGLIAKLTGAIADQILAYNYSPIDNPTFTTAAHAPTPATASNDTSIATTALVQNKLVPYAKLDSPVFSGTPSSASTPAQSDNSGKLATTSFVAGALSSAGSIYNPTFNSAVLAGLDAATGSGQIRIKFSNYGVILRNDGNQFYVLLTANGSPDGPYNTLRPFAINLATGIVAIDGSGAGAGFGGYVTAVTPPTADNSTRLVTSNWVRAQGYAPVNSPNLLGAPFCTTALDGDNSGRIANTNWVQRQFPFSLAASGPPSAGYFKLPNGLIFQWGVTSAIPAGTGQTFNFAQTFACQSIVASYTNGVDVGQATLGNPHNVYLTDSRFSIFNGGSAPAQYYWHAIGT